MQSYACATQVVILTVRLLILVINIMVAQLGKNDKTFKLFATKNKQEITATPSLGAFWISKRLSITTK